MSGCDEQDLIYAHALEVLSATDVARAEAHLATCADCRAELASLRPIVRSFAAWPRDVVRPPASLWDRLAERVGARADDAVPPPPSPPEPEWKEVAPGISCKLLATDSSRGRVSMLVRLAPGVAYPPHEHAGKEELHLLHGELWIDEKKLFPGDYNVAEAGTADARVWSETGCTCVLITSNRDRILQ
jgi:anti-sigma factor ChrR (cupin superfamily)